ncbi:hypothetical protein L5515_009452 [Caenorhabditis briggsae]|uniref:ShKT domain-containing protein n=1 Tax=Caenorhabditis briggsae TaxID=6238 RepID=A0AAE9F8V3_CAEBR|nr:hypothetical protein L5515_009452 [Caenorhabditis briggsae]
MIFTAVLTLFLIIYTSATIVDDLSCSSQGKYLYTATACSNSLPDEICESMYPETSQGSGFPVFGNSAARPFLCYGATEIGGPESQELKKSAIKNCAKTCGFCCLTPEFECKNSLFPRINCDLLTPDHCLSPIFHDYIAQDCPNYCGFCGQGATTRMPTVIEDPLNPCWNPDTSVSCATWKEKGFCTSELYTKEQKKQYCSTTCRVC